MSGIVGVASRGQDNWTLPIASDKDEYLKDARILTQLKLKTNVKGKSECLA